MDSTTPGIINPQHSHLLSSNFQPAAFDRFKLQFDFISRTWMTFFLVENYGNSHKFVLAEVAEEWGNGFDPQSFVQIN